MRPSPTSSLPDDLAHPRGEHAHLIANLSVGATLLVILGGLVLFWFLASAS